MIELFNADCMAVMANYTDKHFDLAVVDPPYGINAANMQMGSAPNRKEDGQYPGISTSVRLKGRLNQGSGKLKNRVLNTSNCDWDINKPTKEYFDELFRVSKNQIIWGGNYFDLPPTRGIICWDKLQPWENFSQWEMAWTSFDVPASMFKYSNTGGANAEKKIHPTQKVVALYKWLLSKYAKTGDKILDTHGGSMSSVIACIDGGFDMVCSELDKDYFDSAVNRINKHVRQMDMFNERPEIIIH